MSNTPRADAKAAEEAERTAAMSVQEHIAEAARLESRAHLATNELATLLRASIHASLAAAKAAGGYSTPTQDPGR